MKLNLATISFHGLRVQVLLWTILPLTILLIVFSLTGISGHQASMHALAAEENSRLVVALAKVISLQANYYALQSQIKLSEVPVDALELDQVVEIEHPDVVVTVALIDRHGNVLFNRGGVVPSGQAILSWPGVPQALMGEKGIVFEPETGEGDLIAYAPVPSTDWILVIREPWHSLTVPLLRFEQATPLILLTAVIISLLILFFGLRFVVQPLHELGIQTSQIGQGNFEAASKPVGGVKEIEDLRQTIDQMAHQLQRYQSALQDYLREITQTQEDERARLGRELHDETVQTLIALGHKAQMVQRTLERDPQQSIERVAELRQMVANAIEEVRRFSRALRPLYLEELGLVPALETLARETEATFRIDGTPGRLKADKELAIYRIAQESLNNARRHANAQNLLIQLSYGGSEVILRVSDDGIGFEIPPNLNELTRTGHFGLMGMRERVQIVGGQIKITSTPSQGTVVTVKVNTLGNDT
ncbi:MAG: HAMP domain-containing protein [Anaerolineaceae bacterium]|nr:HAMP domain-containing protein [Anaerolineaceae bacterium]